jgi:hypothetical protein
MTKKRIIQEKKRHTLKTQVIVERDSLQIIDVQEAKGGEHDFKVYKDTIGNGISNSIPLDADLGYLGIEAYHANSFIPIKSSKKHRLSKREKAYNKRGCCKTSVLQQQITNNACFVRLSLRNCKSLLQSNRLLQQARHSLRMALICGIINYDRRV